MRWTIEQAERVTWLDVTVWQLEDGRYLGVGSDREELIAKGWGETESKAIEAMVAHNYYLVGIKQARKQGWKCADCDKVKPLQRHHKVKRSKGRFDTEENIVMLCAWCHEKRERESSPFKRKLELHS